MILTSSCVTENNTNEHALSECAQAAAAADVMDFRACAQTGTRILRNRQELRSRGDMCGNRSSQAAKSVHSSGNEEHLDRCWEMSANRTCWTLTGATVACVLALYLHRVPRAVAGGDSGNLLRVPLFRSHAANQCPLLYSSARSYLEHMLA